MPDKSFKRVLMGGLYHETHTFIEGRTRLEEFQVLRGDQMLHQVGDSSPLAGALETAHELNWQVVPTIDMRARPGALVEDRALALWWHEFEAALHSALAQDLDGIFLILHGAMVSESWHDVEGELLERINQIVGDDLPVGGVTDLHANFSARMAKFSHALVTYRENPHADAKATAVRAAHILDRLMQSDTRAVTLYEHPPLMWPPTGTATADEPMHSLEQRAREIEQADRNILAFNVHAGYSFADILDTGVSFSIVTTGEVKEAHQYLQNLSSLAIELKERGIVHDLLPVDVLSSVQSMLSEGTGQGPILLIEPSDNIGGGAEGDGTHLLRTLIEYNIKNAGAIINDPEAVRQLSGINPGMRTRLAFGGKSGLLSGDPLELDVELISTHNGNFELEDPHSHLAAGGGSHIEMGPCAVISADGITILLTSHKTPPFDLGQWRSQRINPENLDVIIIKAAVAHRRAYDPIARASFTVATPGPCTSDLRSLPFRHIRRPIYPLDE